MSRHYSTCILVSASLLWSACNPCDTDQPCIEGRQPAADLAGGQGMAGVSYYASDAVANGCWDCSFRESSLALWELDAADPRTPEYAAERIEKEEPSTTLEIVDRYTQPLEPGSYLTCTGTSMHSCAFIDIDAEQTRTVHVNHAAGPPALKVFNAAGDEDPDATFALTP